MTIRRTVLSIAMTVGLLAGTGMAVVNIETVPVGNPGNAPDTQVMTTDGTSGYGSVAYVYNIGKYEVTAGQYTAFLNAVAATDTHGLYNTYMWMHQYGCKIQRNGTSGTYTYSVAPDYANRPVNYVSWGDAARFANWLHNGQPTGVAQGPGTTETGTYTLNGAMTRSQLQAVNRNADWNWAITSEDEWYKAAYHKNDGVTGNSGATRPAATVCQATRWAIRRIRGTMQPTTTTATRSVARTGGRRLAHTRTVIVHTARSTRAATFMNGMKP